MIQFIPKNDPEEIFVVMKSTPNIFGDLIAFCSIHGKMTKTIIAVNEAICAGVPMVLLPHTYEQKLIADRIEELGLGICGVINKISSKKILDSTNRILTDENFKNQAAKYKIIFSEEEKESHIKAANEIFNYLET